MHPLSHIVTPSHTSSHLLTHRLQDYNKPGSANQDPIFTSNSLPSSGTPGYPGGIFDPFGWSKGDMASLRSRRSRTAASP